MINFIGDAWPGVAPAANAQWRNFMNERVVFVCVCIAGLGFFLEAVVLFCRLLKKPSKHRLIECYVEPATYDRLQLMADDFDLSLSTFCSCCLESVDPDELAAAGNRIVEVN